MSDEEEFNSNAWMVTFSDLVMLLLTFFVLLLTMSSMDSKKLESIFTHFQEATGVLNFVDCSEIGDFAKFVQQYNTTETIVMVDHNRLLEGFIPPMAVQDELDNALEQIADKIRIDDDERGIVVSLSEDILFEPGQVQLRPKLLPVLDRIADAVAGCSNPVMIMGHTDSRPTAGGSYASNWELSVFRGLAVLDYFLQRKEFSASRFSVGGYGSARPLQPNDTAANRARNRRVEIILKHLKEG